MAKRKRLISPEQWAQWADERRELQARLEYNEAKIREQREREARRRKRLQRVTFGLLGR